MGDIDWAGTFRDIGGPDDPEGQELLDTFWAAKKAWHQGWKSVRGSKGRLNTAAAAIDDAAKGDRDRIRSELLALVDSEKANAAKFSAAVEAYTVAQLACVAREHQVLSQKKAELEAHRGECRARIKLEDAKIHELTATASRIGGAWAAQSHLVISGLETKRAAIIREALPIERALNMLGARIEWLEMWCASFDARLGGPMIPMMSDAARASIAKPSTWPIAGQERARLARLAACPVS